MACLYATIFERLAERKNFTMTMHFAIVIPHYNHAGTLRRVVEGCLKKNPNVAVFDDGSTVSAAPQLSGLPVSLIRFKNNRGKGVMILEAAHWAKKNGFTHIVTVDADGQHRHQDYPALVRLSRSCPRAIIIGKRKFDKTHVPFSSRFGRSFGGFWVHIQTGKKVTDVQSGYRIYPVDLLLALPLWCKRYAFEVEVVVKALWAGFEVREKEISVVYSKNRISHFSKLKDNLSLTLLNTYLTIRSMLPIPHRQYTIKGKKIAKVGYWEAMLENLRKPGSAAKNGISAAWGMFCGSIALPGIRQVMLFGGAGWFNLNRLLAISFEKLCIGPIIPALCIEVGFFLRHGHFLTEFNLTTLGRQFLSRVWEWVLGSVIVAPVLGLLAFMIVWIISKLITGRLHAKHS